MAAAPSSTLLCFFFLLPLTRGATFEIVNHCAYTIWPAAVPGGGRQLDQGESWTISVDAGTVGRIWARTNCSFDGSGRGQCQTGDCGRLLQCQGNGSPPNSLAEFALNYFNGRDLFDISLVDGFNVPLDFSPAAPATGSCRGYRCSADIVGQCPEALRAPGGCNHPCTVFKTDEYCCSSGTCPPTDYSRFFRRLCPEAYSFPVDGGTATISCPGGTNYTVTFCP